MPALTINELDTDTLFTDIDAAHQNAEDDDGEDYDTTHDIAGQRIDSSDDEDDSSDDLPAHIAGGAHDEIGEARSIADLELARAAGFAQKIEVAARLAKKHGVPFNRVGWEHILTKHDGRLPLRIKAVPEGTVLAAHNVLMTVENTDPECFWLTNYVETLLMQSWYPITVASQSRAMAATIAAALERSGDPAGLAFKLQDFGYRGVTCIEQAGIGGAAHLVNFQGTDTVAALELLGAYYGPKSLPSSVTDAEIHNLASKRMVCEAMGGDTDAVDAEIRAASVRCVWGENVDFMPGFSIPASEHSTITSWGGPEHEIEAFRNMLEQYPTGLVACVSDSFDIYRACELLWGTELHDMIMARDGTLVIRPDSGDPHEVLPRILTVLWEKFGGTVNAKGYKVLDPHIRVIQGDGITADSLVTILNTVMDAGFSADNLVFGSGGGLLQNVTRDTNKFAFKCAAVELDDGTWQDVFKDPITDPGKRSKRGRMKLVRSRIVIETHPEQDGGEQFTTLTEDDGGYDAAEDVMRVIFENGELVVYDELATIRDRAKLTADDIAASAKHAADIAANGKEPSVKDLQAEIAKLKGLLGGVMRDVGRALPCGVDELIGEDEYREAYDAVYGEGALARENA